MGFLAYGVQLLRELVALDVADERLVAKLNRRLRLYRTKYEIWHWMIALTVVFLSFAVSTTVDAQGGHYRINRPLVFVGVVLGQLLFMYAVLKIGSYPVVRETKAILSDLENQVIVETEYVQGLKRTWRLWGLLLAVLAAIPLIWGIYIAMGWG